LLRSYEQKRARSALHIAAKLEVPPALIAVPAAVMLGLAETSPPSPQSRRKIYRGLISLPNVTKMLLVGAVDDGVVACRRTPSKKKIDTDAGVLIAVEPVPLPTRVAR